MEKTTTINLLDWLAPPTTMLGAAIRSLGDQGHEVGMTGEIPGLWSIDGGPEITTNQLISISGILPSPAIDDDRRDKC